MAKHFFFDLETTGTDCSLHGIHQLSGSIVIDGTVKETFDCRMQPHKNAVIVPEALAVSGTTTEMLAAYPSPMAVYRSLTSLMSKYVNKFDKLDKFYCVGFNNASFDNPFLRKWFELNGDKYFGSWFWSCPIDVMILAGQYLLNERPKMPDFKLRTVAEYLGIVIDPARLHDAAYDIDLTMRIYSIVTAPQSVKEPLVLTP